MHFRINKRDYMKKKILFVYLPIILGVLIYIFFRSKSLFYFYFFKLFNLDIYIIAARKYVFLHRKLIPNWVIYSLPDGLWIFSFGSALFLDLKNYVKKLILFCFVFFMTIVFEYIQFYYGGHGSLFGTFDRSDLTCFSIGFILCIAINSFIYYRNKVNSLLPVEVNLPILKVFTNNIKIFLIYFILSILPTLFKMKKG